jgi:ABC-2 type transport system ATP-binding protein
MTPAGRAVNVNTVTTSAPGTPTTGVTERIAVEVHGLTKRFGSRTAVDGLSFALPTGVVAGFIGPNGAGKSTTMGMLLGLVAPTSGTGTVLGSPLGEPSKYLGDVGALIESPAFWPSLTGAENLQLLATLSDHDARAIAGLLELVGLADRAIDRFGSYSLGMKQRLGVAAALLGDPTLLILDEPTNGLDPSGISDMRRLIASVTHDNRTVLVSSHILSELEQVCDWLVVIDEGSLLYQGPADGYVAQAGTVVVIAAEHAGDLDRLARLVRAEGHDSVIDGDQIVVPVELETGDPRALAVTLNAIAFDHGIVLSELRVRRPTLESHYLASVEGDHR